MRIEDRQYSTPLSVSSLARGKIVDNIVHQDLHQVRDGVEEDK